MILPTYIGGSLAELAPEGDLGGDLSAGPLVEAQTLVEGRAVKVKGHDLVHVTRVLHPVETNVVCNQVNNLSVSCIITSRMKSATKSTTSVSVV